MISLRSELRRKLLTYFYTNRSARVLKIPVLAVYGAISNTGPKVEEMMHEVAENVTGLQIPGAAHWIAEENPEAFIGGLLQFLSQS